MTIKLIFSEEQRLMKVYVSSTNKCYFMQQCKRKILKKIMLKEIKADQVIF